MAKPVKPESFEAADDKPYSQANDSRTLIGQITKDYQRESPNCAVLVSFQADQVILRYHCYEQWLDERQRLESTYEAVKDLHKTFMSHLKKEHSRLGGGKLTLKEDKDLHDYFINKVSLNGRFEFTARWVFRLEE